MREKTAGPDTELRDLAGEWLREWLWENPFLLLTTRRRSARRWPWTTMLTSMGWTAAAWLVGYGVLASEALLGGLLAPGTEGTVLMGILVAAHATWLSVVGAKLHFSLSDEAVADRLSFLRLLPLDRRLLVARMGAARAVTRLVALLVPLPLYVLLLACGGLAPADAVAGWALLAVGLLGSTPAAEEIRAAYRSRRGVTGDAASAYRSFAVTGYMLTLQAWVFIVPRSSIGGLLMKLARITARSLSPALGPSISSLLPLSVAAAAARMLWHPVPWFHTSLVLAGPLLAAAGLLAGARWVRAAEYWAREAEPPVEPPAGQLPEPAVAHAHELRQAAWLARAAGALLYLVLTGLIWQPLVRTGVLGLLVGRQTPDGALAALQCLAGGLVIAWGVAPQRGNAEDDCSGRAVREVAGGLAVVTLAAAAAALSGIGSPAGILLNTLRLCATGVGVLAFGAGWRALSAQCSSPLLAPERRRVREGVRATVAAAAGVLPLLVLLPLPPAWQLAGAWSPIGALLALLPGVWARPPVLPWIAAALLPAASGLLLRLAAGRRQPALAPATPDVGGDVRAATTVPRARRDVLERWVSRRAAEWDNPLLLLALARQRRHRLGLTVQLWIGLAWGAGFLALPLAAMPAYAANMGMSYESWPGLLALPVEGTAVSIGALLGLGTGAVSLLILAAAFGMSVYTLVEQEIHDARLQERLGFLLISPLADQELALGALAAAATPSVATVLWCAAGFLAGTLLAVAAGAPAACVYSLLLALAAAAAAAVHAGLAGLARWWPAALPEPWWQGWLRALGSLALGALFLGGLAAVVYVRDGRALAAALLSTVITAILVRGIRFAWRRALAVVRACRCDIDGAVRAAGLDAERRTRYTFG